MTGRELRPKAPDEQGLAPEDAVRCLACSTVYSKPLDAAAIGSACPACGYVGWLSVSLPSEQPPEQRRSAEDRLPHPHVQRG